MTRLKNAMGLPPWCNTAPKPVPDTSQSTMNNLSKYGSCRTGVVVSASFNASNAAAAAGVHRNASRLSSCVNGLAMPLYPLMNFL
jgi:hypothetical protein